MEESLLWLMAVTLGAFFFEARQQRVRILLLQEDIPAVLSSSRTTAVWANACFFSAKGTAITTLALNTSGMDSSTASASCGLMSACVVNSSHDHIVLEAFLTGCSTWRYSHRRPANLLG